MLLRDLHGAFTMMFGPFFATEEGQREYAAWEAEQAELNKKKRAASKAALVCYTGFFFLGPRGLEVGSIGAPFGKYVCS